MDYVYDLTIDQSAVLAMLVSVHLADIADGLLGCKRGLFDRPTALVLIGLAGYDEAQIWAIWRASVGLAHV